MARCPELQLIRVEAYETVAKQYKNAKTVGYVIHIRSVTISATKEAISTVAGK